MLDIYFCVQKFFFVLPLKDKSLSNEMVEIQEEKVWKRGRERGRVGDRGKKIVEMGKKWTMFQMFFQR